MKKILIITTGGTIDKSYSKTYEKLINQATLVPKFVENIRHFNHISFEYFSNLDSKEITNQNRLELTQTISQKQNEIDAIIITHGTDTLVQTALYLEQNLKESKIPIIFTGAMIPLSLVNSDGYQNLIESLFALEFIDQGVWIVMHGKVYSPKKARKNYQKMCFELVE